MKKLSFLICLSLCLTIFSACADTKVSPEEGTTVVTPDSVVTDIAKTTATDEAFENIEPKPFNENNDPNKEIYSQDVTLFLPEVSDVISIDVADYERVSTEKAGLMNKVGDLWVASSRKMDPSLSVLFDPSNDEVIIPEYPENFPDWNYGANSLILQNRYFLEALSHEDGTVKLKKIDAKEKTVEILIEGTPDEVGQRIDLKPIDDERFLVYYTLRPENSEYKTYNVCEICDLDGNRTEILRQGYTELDQNSKGIEHHGYSYYNGELYVISKEIANSKACWYIHKYSLEGELLEVIPLNNFSFLLGNGDVGDFNVVGNYFVATAGTQTTYLYKMNGGNDEIVIKGDGSVSHVVIGDTIAFSIKRDENGDDLESAPIYLLDTKTDTFKVIDVSLEYGMTAKQFTFRKTGNDELLLIDADAYVIPLEDLFANDEGASDGSFEASTEEVSDGSPEGMTVAGETIPEYITENKAKIEAVKHTGYFDYGLGDLDEMTEEDLLGWMNVSVKNIETDLLNKNRNMVYNVTFEIGYYDFDYDIDAQTGEPVSYSKKFDSENVYPDYDGIKAEFNLSGEHFGIVDGVIIESDSKFNDEYLFAAEFVNEFYRFLYSQTGAHNFGKYIKNEQLLEYTETIASTQNIRYKNDPVAGMKIKYTLSDDEDKNFTVGSEHTAVAVVVQGTYQIIYTNDNSGFGRGMQVLVKKNSDGSYEIADWFMGHGGYDEGLRVEYIEFGDADFWNTPEKYEQLLSDTREFCKNLSEKFTSQYGSDPESHITQDQAKTIVAKHADVKESKISDFECSLLEADGAPAFYEIRFKTEGYEYYYKIVAKDGYIIEYAKGYKD